MICISNFDLAGIYEVRNGLTVGEGLAPPALLIYLFCNGRTKALPYGAKRKSNGTYTKECQFTFVGRGLAPAVTELRNQRCGGTKAPPYNVKTSHSSLNPNLYSKTEPCQGSVLKIICLSFRRGDLQTAVRFFPICRRQAFPTCAPRLLFDPFP